MSLRKDGLMFGMEVKVTHLYYMGHENSKSLHKRKTGHHLLNNPLETEFDLYSKGRSQ